MRGLFLFFFTATSTFAGQTDCSSIPYFAVAPQGHSRQASCDPLHDKLKCQLAQGYSKFGFEPFTEGWPSEALSLRLDPSRDRALDELFRSPVIQEVNALRLRARLIAGTENPCAPHYFYMGDKEVFGVGPAFVSSKRFWISDNGDHSTNFILAEDVKAPFHLPLEVISKESLKRAHYFDIVIAHEMAHGLMQDLYGLKDFSELEASSVSRDGHMASQVTDPAIALIEGFAEGFEAYLAEKYLTRAEQATPTLDRAMKRIQDRAELFDDHGWPLFLLTLPVTIFQTLKSLVNIDDFVADFLKAERLEPVWANHYVLKGPMVNLAHKYGIAPSAIGADAEEMQDWEAEPLDAIWSKEGAVAHFVYRVLREGFAEELFSALSWAKPRNFRELAHVFRAELDVEKFERLTDLYKSLFTGYGRDTVALFLSQEGMTPKKLELKLKKRFAKTKLAEGPSDPPKDFWIEFMNTSMLRIKFYGTLDRINLSTAPPSRVRDFFNSIAPLKSQSGSLLKKFLAFRSAREDLGTLEEFSEAWVKKDGPSVERAAQDLIIFHGCYLRRCVEKKAM